MNLIDLTHPLNASVPSWSGGCGFFLHQKKDYDPEEQPSFRVQKLELHAGIGTHLDAPSHCIPNGRSVAELTLEELCVPCVVIDVSHKAHETYQVSYNDLKVFEQSYGKIPERSCVLIHTGWSRYWLSAEQYRNNHRFPSVSKEVAEALVDRNVVGLGIDTLSPDCPENGFLVHQILLSNNCYILENVANLTLMPLQGGKIIAFPLKIQDGTESPVRLVGLTSFS